MLLDIRNSDASDGSSLSINSNEQSDRGSSRIDSNRSSIRFDSNHCNQMRKSLSDSNARGSTSSVSPLIPQRRLSNSPDWLTIDKLNIANLSLYDRDQELAIIKKSLQDVSLGLVARHLILISGFSGTGKTTLANALRAPTAKLKGLFVRGKFDFNNRHEPYSGVATACEEICKHLLSLQVTNLSLFQKVADRIRAELGSELSLLIKVIPGLRKVSGCPKNDGNLSLVGSSSVVARNRLYFSFQRFIRVISLEFAPLVLALDDLQWADGASLNFLDACLLDRSNTKFMVVGTYRSNEVTESNVLHNTIKGLRAKREDAVLEISEISIGNLSVEGIDNMIASLLSMDNDTQTMGLAEVCLKKTQGNAFFVLQFLQMLRNTDLLQYDFGTMSWKWNNNEIDENTSATDNVVNLLNAKMEYLPHHLLAILKIAAFLGSTFTEICLRHVWEDMSSLLSEQNDKYEALNSGLLYLEQDGYIIRHCSESVQSSSRSFSWTHDKVQEAAIELIPEEEGAMFSYEAGDILLSRLSAGELESSLFVVVGLLNVAEALVADEEKRVRIANLNFDASLKALSISAFESVAEFSAKGIKYLPRDHWINHYQLSLDLYSTAARAEGFLGNVNLMEQYCHTVLSQESPVKDKLLVYHTLVDSLISRCLVEKATNLLFKVLEMCDCHFHQNPILIRAVIMASASNMKSTMKSNNDLDLAEMQNPKIFEITMLLDKLMTCLYLTKDVRLALIVFRIRDCTMKHGYCEYSPVAFAAIGVMFCGIFREFHLGSWYGEQALRLLEKSQSSATNSRTMLLVYSKVFIWTKPLVKLIQPLQHSYDVGLQSGDLESAIWSICAWLNLRYITGVPLGILDHDYQLICRQMKDLNRKLTLTYCNCIRQAILNLMDSDQGNPMTLIGEACSTDDYRQCVEDSYLSTAISTWQGILLTYFGDHIRRADFVLQEGFNYLQKTMPSTATIAFDSLLRGISCFAAARDTGKRKYARMGEKLRSQMRKWREMGNPNVTHYTSFLDAESSALRNKSDDAIRHYEATIIFAGRTGFIQDAAFACERLSEYQLKHMANKDEAVQRMSQSLRYWRDWGALGKVKDLEKKYPELCLASLR